MEVSGGSQEGFVREWTPCTHILSLIPPRTQSGLFSNELSLTCVDVISEYIALGTNVGLVYWYDRKKGTIQRLRCEISSSPITFVKIVNTVDYMVGAGNAAGQVTVFQIPKEHPENVPDTFKPKVEPKVERYTIGDLHKSKITSIEWAKNGMRLFSGDKNGVIIMTEIDFYMHLCKSMEIVNEEHEIVQMSYYQNMLLVSSLYRTIVCERKDGKWHINQLGKKERKSLCALGATVAHSYALGGARAAVCYSARPGLRLWRSPPADHVLQTLVFKEAISNPLTVVELLNPSQQKHVHSDRKYQFGPLQVFREHFLVSHNDSFLYILDPRTCTAVAVVDDLRKILSVSVHKDEIFILEGPRSLVRLAPAPEPAALHSDDPLNLMTKSLTTSLQQAVNTVKDLTHLDQTVPYITSVLEQPIAMFTKNEFLDSAVVSNAEECFELPPIKSLPGDISNNVLESIINEFKDVSSEAEEIRRVKSEELQRKLKLYNSIMEKKHEGELIHSSRRSRRRDNGSGGSTPRVATPVRKPVGDVSYTTPCVMSVSVYGNLPPENDDLLEKQIEEKEKILAKMLNLESLSIKTTNIEETNLTTNPESVPTYGQNNHVTKKTADELVNKEKVIKQVPKKTKTDLNPIDLMPKIVQLPNTWNLDNIELKLEEKSNGFDTRTLVSPDDHIESEWEFI